MRVESLLRKRSVSKEAWAKLTRGLSGEESLAAKYMYDLRIGSLYVYYDFNKKEWISPEKFAIREGIALDMKFCFPLLSTALLHSKVLKRLIEGSPRNHTETTQGPELRF